MGVPRLPLLRPKDPAPPPGMAGLWDIPSPPQCLLCPGEERSRAGQGPSISSNSQNGISLELAYVTEKGGIT